MKFAYTIAYVADVAGFRRARGAGRRHAGRAVHGGRLRLKVQRG